MTIDLAGVEKFTPSYVWPNPAFHFRHYFDHPRCRIFLIENITHNWQWLLRYAERIQPRDYFIVQLGWFFHDWLIEESMKVLQLLGLAREKFLILFADSASQALFEYHGFRGALVNHNAFLDERLFRVDQVDKLYDAIYTARFSLFKRHYLARKVQKLALVAGTNYGVPTDEIPAHDYLNETVLSQQEVVHKINQSRTGLCLSEVEGSCFSSSEYLLCGIPVVSTWSHGGRAVWYNDYNSIICDANEDAVAEGVARLATSGRNAERIRTTHIQQAEAYRRNFIKLLGDVFSERDVKEDPEKYFRDNFQHKMLLSIEPPFPEIFPEHGFDR